MAWASHCEIVEMSEEYPLKDEEFYGDLKKNDGRRRKKRYCPHCGNEMHARMIGSFLFCDRCHERMPWTVAKEDDKPLKPL